MKKVSVKCKGMVPYALRSLLAKFFKFYPPIGADLKPQRNADKRLYQALF